MVIVKKGKKMKKKVDKTRSSSSKKRRKGEEDEEEGDSTAEPVEEEAETAPTQTGDDKDDVDDTEGLGSLMKLRALLAPTTAGKKTVGDDEAGADDKEGENAVSTSDKKDLEPEGPDWTNRYCVVDAAGPLTPLDELARPLHPAMEGALKKAGFNPLFPIQAAVIPLLSLSAEALWDNDSPYCCDVCVAAPTGQGKTLSYAVPIVQALLDRLSPAPRAVVLLPTRDLALQVHKVFESIRLGLVGTGVAQIRAQCLVGQKSLIEEQRSLNTNPPDVIVCTPGRLAEHFLGRDAKLDLSALRWFVVDEADRLLTQTYHRWIDVLERVCGDPMAEPTTPGPRPQKLLISATMTWDPRKLAALKLRRPLYFFSSRTGQHATPAQLSQYYVRCRTAAKPLAVLHLLRRVLGRNEDGSKVAADANSSKVVIFCPSVNTAHRLARLLQICSALGPEALAEKRQKASKVALEKNDDEGEEEEEMEDDEEEVDDDEDDPLSQPGAIAEFSSNLSQTERNILLKRFRNARVKCLVCSDVVARGIDIPEVTAVVNYQAPSHIQTYIHRVGRTARAGRAGHTFTFVRKPEMDRFETMLRESADCWERISKYPLPQDARDTSQQWWPKALNFLQTCLEMESRGDLSINKAIHLSDLDPSYKTDEKSVEKEKVDGDEASDEPSKDESSKKGKPSEVGAKEARTHSTICSPGLVHLESHGEGKGGSLLDFAKSLRRGLTSRKRGRSDT